jgi:hypothetical protein
MLPYLEHKYPIIGLMNDEKEGRFKRKRCYIRRGIVLSFALRERGKQRKTGNLASVRLEFKTSTPEYKSRALSIGQPVLYRISVPK